MLEQCLPDGEGRSVYWALTDRRLLFYRWSMCLKDLERWDVYPHYIPPGTSREKAIGVIMSFLSKNKGPGGNGPTRVMSDKEFPRRWPCLWEYLTVEEYPDGGGARKLATISLFLGSTGPTACLNDKDNARSLFGSSSSFLGALDALETLAKSDQAVWREDKHQTGTSARKKGEK